MVKLKSCSMDICSITKTHAIGALDHIAKKLAPKIVCLENCGERYLITLKICPALWSLTNSQGLLKRFFNIQDFLTAGYPWPRTGY